MRKKTTVYIDEDLLVVDPNVWVSGLLSPSGAPAAVVQAVIDGAVVAVGTPHLVDEVAAVLMRRQSD